MVEEVGLLPVRGDEISPCELPFEAPHRLFAVGLRECCHYFLPFRFMFLGLLCLGLSLARLRISSIMLGELLPERLGIGTGFIPSASASSVGARRIPLLLAGALFPPPNFGLALDFLGDFGRILGSGISYLPLPFRGAFGFRTCLRGFFLP